MGYTVGVSSGMYMMAQQDEKGQYITIPKKIFRGGMEGVNFTQVDIETITEFNEPYLEKETEKIKNLGIEFGVHGESYAMGGGEKPMGMLDSAIETNYIHSHDRLIKHIDGCGLIGAKYVNIHPSETMPFLKLNMSFQPTTLVDPWGRSFKEFFKENPDILDWVITDDASFIWEFSRRTLEEWKSIFARQIYNDYQRKHKDKSISERELEREVEKELKDYFIGMITTPDLSYGPERVAYYLVAKWMKKKKHQLWKDIVKKKLDDKDFANPKKYQEWVPAVSAMYIMGHFRPKDTDKYEDPLPKLKKNKLWFCFESQMGSSGLEGMQRLCKPIDMIYICKAIGSEWVTVTIDVEHVLSQNLDPIKEAKEIPKGLAKHVRVIHIGFPTPHTPAHMPLDLGSREQRYIYEFIYELRQRGFVDGYLIFERGSAPRGTSIPAIKKIKEFLEKDIVPDELPIDFYGMDKDDYRVSKQQVAIREHAFDPLKGLLSVEEEEHTFLGSQAVRKGKGEEWKRRKYR